MVFSTLKPNDPRKTDGAMTKHLAYGTTAKVLHWLTVALLIIHYIHRRVRIE